MRITLRIARWLAPWLLAWTSPLLAQADPTEILFRNVRVFDGVGPQLSAPTDVLVRGNLIHNPGPPRYKVAVILPDGPNAPRGVHFADNLFPPGTAGVANRALPE